MTQSDKSVPAYDDGSAVGSLSTPTGQMSTIDSRMQRHAVAAVPGTASWLTTSLAFDLVRQKAPERAIAYTF